METYYLIIIPRLSGLLIRNSNRLANSATEDGRRPREEKRWSGYWTRSGNPNSGRSARVLWETVHFFFLEIWDRRKDFMFSVRFLAFLCCSGLVLTRRMTLSRSDSFFINKSHSNSIFIEVYFSSIHPSIQEWPAKIHKECRTRHRIPQQEARGKLILDRLLLTSFDDEKIWRILLLKNLRQQTRSPSLIRTGRHSVLTQKFSTMSIHVIFSRESLIFISVLEWTC